MGGGAVPRRRRPQPVPSPPAPAAEAPARSRSTAGRAAAGSGGHRCSGRAGARQREGRRGARRPSSPLTRPSRCRRPTNDAEAQTAPPVTPEQVEAAVTEEGTAHRAASARAAAECRGRQPDQRQPLCHQHRHQRRHLHALQGSRPRRPRRPRGLLRRAAATAASRQIVIRDDGTQVITVWNRYGEIVTPREGAAGRPPHRHRLRRRCDRGDWRDPGDDLPPFRLTHPGERVRALQRAGGRGRDRRRSSTSRRWSRRSASTRSTRSSARPVSATRSAASISVTSRSTPARRRSSATRSAR